MAFSDRPPRHIFWVRGFLRSKWGKTVPAREGGGMREGVGAWKGRVHFPPSLSPS